MSWSINVPHRLRSDSLSDVAVAARALATDEDRSVCRQLVLAEITGGTAQTAGDLIDKLEKASHEERRKMLDDARVAAGLESATELDFRERHKQHQRNALARAAGAPPPRYALNDVGLLVDLAEIEVERERIAAAEESRRQFREDREAERAVEADAMLEHERAQRERFRRETPQVRV